MFRTCTHWEVASSLEGIGAPFAILELKQHRLGSTVLVSANTLFEEITKTPVTECIGLTLAEFLPHYIEKQMRACLAVCLAKHSAQETEVTTEREGENNWWRFLASPVIPDDNSNMRMIVTMIDITEKKLLADTLEFARQRYEAVVQTAYDGIITIDQDQKILMMNDTARDMFGIANGDGGVGDPLSRFIPQRFQDHHAHYVEAFRHSAISVRPMQPRSSVYGLRADGSEVPIEVTISKIKVGTEAEMTAVIRDMSERTRMIEQLKQAATTDSLTGIFNRRHGTAVMTSEIHRCKRFNHPLAVAMLDIDHFKAVNDRYGHAGGDLVLRSIAASISKKLRDIDTFCRWGGEEFLVVLPETELDEALLWANRVREAVAAEAIANGVGQNSIRITASFGVAALNPESPRLEELVKRADDALYRAKKAGRNQVYADPTVVAAG